MYLYLEDDAALPEAEAILARTEGIDEVLRRAEAGRHHLPWDRVGDLVCFGARQYALGIWAEGPPARDEVGLRSHGSAHEQAVPMILAGPGIQPGAEIRSGSMVDLAPTLCRLVGIKAGAVQGRVLDEILE